MSLYHENDQLIIELSDVITGPNGKTFYRVKNFENIIFSEEDLEKLMRAADLKGRASEEAWRFYKKCATKGYEENTWAEQNTSSLSGMSYKKAKSLYDSWKKKLTWSPKTGDVVKLSNGENAIVLEHSPDNGSVFLLSPGYQKILRKIEEISPTGEFFSVDGLLEVLGVY